MAPQKQAREIVNKLVEAEGFEKFIDVKYTGTKRLGSDGGESLIRRWSRSSSVAHFGVQEVIVVGVAHRRAAWEDAGSEQSPAALFTS